VPWVNRHNIPETLAESIRKKNSKYKHDDDPNHFSATEILQPTRITVLKRRFRGKLVYDVGDSFFKADGNAVHEMLEEVEIKPPVLFKEQRFEIKIGDYRISGQIDLYQEGGIISDWKKTTIFAAQKKHKPDWEGQLNIYAMLLRAAGLPVNELHIYAILRDWKKGMVGRQKDYPEIGFIDREFPVLEDASVRGMVWERIDAVKKAEDLNVKALPLCTPEERWVYEECWAVRKLGNKSASKLCHSHEEAELWIHDSGKKNFKYEIEHRPGVSIRCRDWCDVKEYCTQWHKEFGGK
jgi:hypothetical protein